MIYMCTAHQLKSTERRNKSFKERCKLIKHLFNLFTDQCIISSIKVRFRSSTSSFKWFRPLLYSMDENVNWCIAKGPFQTRYHMPVYIKGEVHTIHFSVRFSIQFFLLAKKIVSFDHKSRKSNRKLVSKSVGVLFPSKSNENRIVKR